MEERSDSRPGNQPSSDDLLPLLYAELRRLARARMAQLPPGNTLQPTALVHEAFLRLNKSGEARFSGKAHFFGAAALAMRQILADQARRKSARKHGGGQERLDVDELELAIEAPSEDILALDRALEKLEREDPRKSQIVMLRYFAGLDREEVAELLGISLRTVDREWRYIVARLHKEIAEDPGESR